MTHPTKGLYDDKRNISADITIVSSEGKEFHKILALLVNTSKYFELCLSGSEAKTKKMKTNIPAKYLDVILRYCYERETPKLFDSLDENIQLIKYMDMCLMNEVIDAFELKIAESINFSNVIKYFNLSTSTTYPLNTINTKCIEILQYLIEFTKTGIMCPDLLSKQKSGRHCCKHEHYFTKDLKSVCCRANNLPSECPNKYVNGNCKYKHTCCKHFPKSGEKNEIPAFDIKDLNSTAKDLLLSSLYRFPGHFA